MRPCPVTTNDGVASKRRAHSPSRPDLERPLMTDRRVPRSLLFLAALLLIAASCSSDSDGATSTDETDEETTLSPTTEQVTTAPSTTNATTTSSTAEEVDPEAAVREVHPIHDRAVRTR